MVSLRLKTLRRMHGLTQQKIAEEMNVSQQSISRYEAGRHYPDLDTLIQLADYFDVPLDYMIGREWPKNPINKVYLDAAAVPTDTSDHDESDAEIAAEARRIVSVYKASEELSQDILRLDLLSEDGRDQMRKLYKVVLAAERNR